jgi:hypothetical protein
MQSLPKRPSRVCPEEASPTPVDGDNNGERREISDEHNQWMKHTLTLKRRRPLITRASTVLFDFCHRSSFIIPHTHTYNVKFEKS